MTGAAPGVRLQPFTGGAAEWDALCARFSDFSVVQSWAAGEARRAADARWRPERCVFMRAGDAAGDAAGGACGAAQVMVRDAPFGLGRLGRLAWIARGPVFDVPSDAAAGFAVFRAMAAALRARYARGFGGYLRMAPPVLESAAPEIPGFRITAQTGWASAAVDLAPSVDELRANLKGKWRNALSKAERAGVEIRAAHDAAAVDAFAAGHDAFMASLPGGARGSVTGAWIKALAAAGGDVCVFESHLGGVPAGRVMTVRTGARAEYLAGHTESAGRDAGAGQALLWAALTAAKNTGAQKFDAGGMDPVKTPKGVYDYKDGMQGAPYRLMNEIDACAGAGARAVRARTDAARAAMGA